MSKITLNPERIGNITSSKAYKLFGSPAVQKTYIEEKRIEKRLARVLETDVYSNAIAWGELMERRVNDILGLAYKSTGHSSKHHPNAEFRWAGTPDVINQREGIIAEIKGYQPKNFAIYSDCLIQANKEGKPDIIRKECPEEYWQAISNAAIFNLKTVELMVYMPYESELPQIAELAANWEDETQWRYKRFFDAINQGKKEEVAYLPDGGYYKNLNKFKFEVPAMDIQNITNAVIKATSLINA